MVNQTQPPPDSRLTLEAREDGEWTVEVADRYNEGGPAYGYRLEVGTTRPDFAISLLFNDANANRRNVMVAANARQTRPSGPGVTGERSTSSRVGRGPPSISWSRRRGKPGQSRFAQKICRRG